MEFEVLLNYIASCITISSIICSLALQRFGILRIFLYPFVDIEYFYVHLWSIHVVMIFNSMNWCVWVCLCRCYPTGKYLVNVSHYYDSSTVAKATWLTESLVPPCDMMREKNPFRIPVPELLSVWLPLSLSPPIFSICTCIYTQSK